MKKLLVVLAVSAFVFASCNQKPKEEEAVVEEAVVEEPVVEQPAVADSTATVEGVVAE